MMKKLFVLSFAIFLIIVDLSAQQRGQRGQRGGGPDGARPGLKVSGQVLDSQTGTGLEFATVSIFNRRDSTLLGGGLTDPDGKFSVDVKPGPMYAEIEFISYETKVIDIEIDREQLQAGNREIKLGVVNLNLNSTQLDEVEIRAERSETQFTLDKRVFNVGKDLANQGGSAEDILDNVPSVTVDIDGNVSLRGSEGVKILVDGKPSGLVGIRNSSGLKNIPADMILQVEVITNPSAKYGAEGSAGILNLILKKDTRGGFNGSFNASAGYPERAGVGANVNYRKGNLNWFANYGLRHRTGPGGGFNYSERTVGSITEILDAQRDNDRGGLSNSIVFGADYFFNDDEQLTAQLNYRISDDYSFNEITYDSLIATNNNALNPTYLSQTTRIDDESEDENNLEYSLNYRKNFSDRNHYLNAKVSYRDQNESESSLFDEFYTPIGEPGFANLIQRSSNDEKEKTWVFEVDYSKQLGKGHKYEFGFRTSLRDIGNDYLVEQQNSDLRWETLILGEELFDNSFAYDENIYATYGSYGNKVGKFSYNFVLGAEYTDVTTLQSNSNKSIPRSYFDLFPSIYLNYATSEANAFQISYSRRIQRPRFFYLNPFFTLSDRINLFGGNPELNPEYTDSYEIGNIRYWDDMTLSSSFFYRHTTANIQRLTVLNCDGTTTRRPNNAGTSDDYGLDMNLSYSGVKWLRLDANGNFFRATSQGSYPVTDCSDMFGIGMEEEREFEVDNFTWFGRLTARITVFDSDLQIRSYWRGARAGAQGNSRGSGAVDLGWSKDFLNEALTVTLSMRDIFNSRRYAGETLLPNFYATNEYRRASRATTLSFSYRINQKKRRQRPQGGGGGGFEGGEEF